MLDEYPVRAAVNRGLSSARLVVSNGTIEGLKWVGLLLMTGDHVNKYLFAERLPGLSELGRLAMPIFGFVLAYNLARPGALEDKPQVEPVPRVMAAQQPLPRLGTRPAYVPRKLLVEGQ